MLNRTERARVGGLTGHITLENRGFLCLAVACGAGRQRLCSLPYVGSCSCITQR